MPIQSFRVSGGCSIFIVFHTESSVSRYVDTDRKPRYSASEVGLRCLNMFPCIFLLKVGWDLQKKLKPQVILLLVVPNE